MNNTLNNEIRYEETDSIYAVSYTHLYPATIKGRQDVEIRPQVSGFITKLCVDEGATVRKGQLLFIIDPTQYEAAVRTAKASVATAEAAVNTQQMTVDNKMCIRDSSTSGLSASMS